MPIERPAGAALAHPRHWLTWFGFAVLRLLSALPARPRLLVGRLLGRVAYRFGGRMRHDVAVNLALCFADLDAAARAALLRDHFDAFGCALVEAGQAWWGRDAALAAAVEWEGFEHLESAMASGHGVIMLTGHFTTFELGARLLATRIPLDVTYKRDKNPWIERRMRAWRGRHFGHVIATDDVRTMVRRLRAGGVVWYAPDQNFHRKGRVFADFFGVPAATNPATARIAKVTGALVVPYGVQRCGMRYRVTILPPLAGFPSGDPVADAATVNGAIEALVRQAPEQYLWKLRRFDTRPDGEPNPYRAV